MRMIDENDNGIIYKHFKFTFLERLIIFILGRICFEMEREIK